MCTDFLKKAAYSCYEADYTLTIDERIQLAEYAKSAGMYDAAEKLYKSLPECEKVNLGLADTYHLQKKYAQAKRLYYDTWVKYSPAIAKKRLNGLCLELSSNYFINCPKKSGVLRDYDGKEISFDRGNIPVKGTLKFSEDGAVFLIEVNVLMRRISDMRLTKPVRPIIQGIKQWQGNYLVFGGYPIEARVKCTTELRRRSSLIVNIFDDETTDSIADILKKFGKRGKRSASILSARRQSAASVGKSWRLGAVKYINLYEQDLLNIPRCKFLMRHEFGHILGLDDMYQERSEGRKGVYEVYPDIEMFRIKGNIFNMIMCSEDAPVTFKDIEMALLAYRDGIIQRFQQTNGKGEISQALKN